MNPPGVGVQHPERERGIRLDPGQKVGLVYHGDSGLANSAHCGRTDCPLKDGHLAKVVTLVENGEAALRAVAFDDDLDLPILDDIHRLM